MAAPVLRLALILLVAVLAGTAARAAQGPACDTFRLSPSERVNIGAASGQFELTVTGTAGCWYQVEVDESEPWLGTSWDFVEIYEEGEGSAFISWDANEEGPRHSFVRVTVGEGTGYRLLQVYQSSAECVSGLSASALHFPVEGGSGTVHVAAPYNCPWSIASSAGWIALTSTGGDGPMDITFSVTENEGAARAGTITAGSKAVGLNQEGVADPTPDPRPAPDPGAPPLGTGSGGEDIHVEPGLDALATVAVLGASAVLTLLRRR